MHRSAAGIVHSLLRNSITAAEAPASAWTGLLVGPSLLQGLLGGSMSASQLPARCAPCTALEGGSFYAVFTHARRRMSLVLAEQYKQHSSEGS